MRMAFVGFSLACLLLSFQGCGGGGSPESPLAPRLEAAKAVSDPEARDKDLAKLALEAGTAGDIPIANDALAAISNEALREQTKPKLILRLAKAGKRDAATKLEQTISDVKARERLELKIRSRDFSE
jgi:hypothetical protein